MTYKGLMFSGVPNFAITFGYTNASWTLKADLVSEFVCRLLNYMDAKGFDTVEPQHPGDDCRRVAVHGLQPWLLSAFNATYSPSRGRARRGGSSRTTSLTCGRSGAARSMTRVCDSPKSLRQWLFKAA